MIQLSYSPRVSNFVDAADVSGNIKNNPLYLQYLHQIDVACIKAGITTGAVYPIIGGNATSHSFNFLNPAQFQITWYGTITHTISGVKGDGTTGYGDTGMPANMFTITSGVSAGIYVNDQTTLRMSAELGSSGAGANPDFNSLQLRVGFNTGAVQFISFGNYNGVTPTTNVVPPIGYYMGNKIPSVNNKSVYSYNRTILTSTSSADTNISDNQTLLVLARKTDTGVASLFSNKGISFVNINNGILTDLQAKVFSNDIYVANRSIGR